LRKKIERTAAAVCGILRTIFYFIFAVGRIMDDEEDDPNHSHSIKSTSIHEPQDNQVRKKIKNSCFV
jgi:hypothetical protein